MKQKRLCAMLIPLLITACGGGGSDGGSEAETVSPPPTQPPVTEGAWYRPAVGVRWQWQLDGALNTSYPVELYDIDLFETSSDTIDALHADGKKVICYFSAGSYENWRPDAGDFQAEELGDSLDGWAGERWLDIRSDNVRAIMQARLELAQSKGCDGVEPDNVDGYANDTGFALTTTDQVEYNAFIANAAHELSLAVALKNDVEQVSVLVDYFDFAVNEECMTYDECDTLAPFISNGKPVLHVEYDSRHVTNDSAFQALCSNTQAREFSTLVLPLELDDSFRKSCE